MRYKMERKKKLTLTEKAPEKGDRFEFFFHDPRDPSVIIQSEEEDE